MENIVSINSLSFSYVNTTHKALDNLSLKINRGEFYGLLGPNGAGKTTLLSLLCKQRDDQSQGIRLFDIKLNQLGKSILKVGYAPQELALYPMLSGRENLEFFCHILGLSKEEGLKQIDHVLKVVNLIESENKAVADYSGGMKRRLNLAVALLNDPELLILDEPTVGVDPQSRNLIFEKIKELNKSGVTVIYTTHYMEEVEKLCDKVAIINEGRLCFDGSLEKLMRDHQNSSLEKIYLELTGYEVRD